MTWTNHSNSRDVHVSELDTIECDTRALFTTGAHGCVVHGLIRSGGTRRGLVPDVIDCLSNAMRFSERMLVCERMTRRTYENHAFGFRVDLDAAALDEAWSLSQRDPGHMTSAEADRWSEMFQARNVSMAIERENDRAGVLARFSDVALERDEVLRCVLCQCPHAKLERDTLRWEDDRWLELPASRLRASVLSLGRQVTFEAVSVRRGKVDLVCFWMQPRTLSDQDSLLEALQRGTSSLPRAR
ncbi:MAG: hypothetical protein H6833_07345 [Planctomycetes bacterium]|nr:hypothetical protein [Planctomycetota bacterium]